MSHQQNSTGPLNHDPLDAVLRGEFDSAEQLHPSSGFVLSVMDAIQEEAAVPPPIPFPWRRILPSGIAILCALITFLIFAAVHSGPTIAESSRFSLPAFTAFDTTLYGVALAIALTVIAVSASFRLANRR